MFEVTNQPPPLEPYNLFASDAVLREAVKRESAGWADDGLERARRHARQAGDGRSSALTPTAIRRCCARFDRYGHRIDEVEFHPAWHELMAIALRAGLHSSPWAEPQAGRACGARRRHLHARRRSRAASIARSP